MKPKSSHNKIYLFFLVLLSVFILPLASAVTIDDGTTFNATGNNASLSFIGCTWEATNVTVFTNSIYVHGGATWTVGYYTYTFDNPVIWNTANTNLNCDEIPLALGNEQSTAIAGICSDSDNAFIDAIPLVGIILTVILVGAVLAILVGVMMGYINISNLSFNPATDMDSLIKGALIVGLTGLIIATLAYILGGTLCTVFAT